MISQCRGDLTGIRLRRAFRTAAALAALLGVWAGGAWGQDEQLTVEELEGLYRSARDGYEEAFGVLEVLSSQFERASQAFSAALAAGDRAARDSAYAETISLGSRRRQAGKRVEEKVIELQEARRRLLDATAERLDQYLAVADTASDPLLSQELETLVVDTRNRIQELRDEEDPPLTLEPLPDINQQPRDSPAELRGKATILEVTATQYEEQLAYNSEQLDGLRRDQNLLRRSQDFLADRARFDDVPVPVGPPTARTGNPGAGVQPPGADSLRVGGGFLTLEERIQALEALQEEITERIGIIRNRAAELRRAAGGEWA